MSDLFWDHVADQAVRALLYELAATPKPGLVDRANNGAHHDMTFATFLDSACALRPYFAAVTEFAASSSLPDEALLGAARHHGMAAEARMLAATNGVNTHKGAIFSLGLVCLAAGRLYQSGKPLTPGHLLTLAGRIAADTPAELSAAPEKIHPTHGEEQFLRHGLTGIRGEAAAGFPSVRELALPILSDLLAAGCSENDAGVVTLLHLMARVADTNVIRRGGLARQQELARELSALLDSRPTPETLIAHAAELDRRLIAEHISPGGCADLLALCWLVRFLCAS